MEFLGAKSAIYVVCRGAGTAGMDGANDIDNADCKADADAGVVPHSPAARSSAAAVLSPTPLMPGTLSDVSPASESNSGSARGLTPKSASTSASFKSLPRPPPRAGLTNATEGKGGHFM